MAQSFQPFDPFASDDRDLAQRQREEVIAELSEKAEEAKAAAERARDLADTLIPIMDEHGFTYAGEAIEFLLRQQAERGES